MTPVLAQGCNSGLEDATIFAQMLQRCGGDIDSLLPAYTAARLPEITALVNINELVAQERHTLKVGHPVIVVQSCCGSWNLSTKSRRQQAAGFEAAWLSALSADEAIFLQRTVQCGRDSCHLPSEKGSWMQGSRQGYLYSL